MAIETAEAAKMLLKMTFGTDSPSIFEIEEKYSTIICELNSIILEKNVWGFVTLNHLNSNPIDPTLSARNIRGLNNGKFPSHAYPGGYPIYYTLHGSNAKTCWRCAEDIVARVNGWHVIRDRSEGVFSKCIHCGITFHTAEELTHEQ